MIYAFRGKPLEKLAKGNQNAGWLVSPPEPASICDIMEPTIPQRIIFPPMTSYLEDYYYFED